MKIDKETTVLINYFTELVKIDSPSGEEKEIGEYLKKWLSKNKFSFNQDKVGNILAQKKSTGVPILFCAHMDTVDPGRGIKPVIKNDNIQSSGDTILGADNKVAIAAIMTAIEEYSGSRSLEILFTVEEETIGGIAQVDFKKIKSKYGVIFDLAKPIGEIVVAASYIINFHLEFKGISSHSSRPKEGVNALFPAVDFVEEIKKFFSLQNETIVNIGKLQSGSVVNAVPGFSVIDGEIRSFDKKDFDIKIAKIKELAGQVAKQYEVKSKIIFDGYCSGYEVSKNDTFVKKIENCLNLLGHKTSFVKTYGISDSNALINAGIKVINLSDGVNNAHTTEENVKISSIVELKKVILTMIDDLT